MAFIGMTIGPAPQVVDLEADVKWTVQNVSEDHSAVLRLTVQRAGVMPAANVYGAVPWLRAATVSRDTNERLWMHVEGADGCEIIIERAT